MKRSELNEQILRKLSKYLRDNPDIRFIQALWNLKIIDSVTDEFGYKEVIDRFYEEPIHTLKRING